MPVPVLFLEIASAHKQPVGESEAISTSRQLIRTLQQLRKINSRISLNAAIRLPDCNVAPGRTLGATLGGPEFRLEWEFLRLLATQSPLSAGMESSLPRAELTDAQLEGGQGFYGQDEAALVWAHLLQTATVSFNTEIPWNQPWVDAHFQSLNDAGDLAEISERIRNASTPDHATEHGDWLRTLGFSASPTGSDFWASRDDRLTGLRFLDRVRSQIDDLSTSGAPYKQALRSLESLNKDSLNWDGQGEPTFSEKVADGEHDGRKELSRFLDNATGQTHFFDKHAYFTGGTAGRIHFRLAPDEKKFVVAHVGFKLQ